MTSLPCDPFMQARLLDGGVLMDPQPRQPKDWPMARFLRTMTSTLDDHFQHEDVESFSYCLGTGKILRDIQSLP